MKSNCESGAKPMEWFLTAVCLPPPAQQSGGCNMTWNVNPTYSSAALPAIDNDVYKKVLDKTANHILTDTLKA